MATKVLDNNQSRVPFFGERMSFINGLDPLGLQNASVQMYSYLLPGLNNVTLRIAYYGFYCWVLSEYAVRIGSTDPMEQKRFIRRAEYIAALVSATANLQGIPGINYALDQVQSSINEFDLQSGTYQENGSTEETYWKYSFGIFGQYYLGSLRQIGLIEEPVDEMGERMGIYRRTSKKDAEHISGEELSEAFDSRLTFETKELFFKAIELGNITRQQLHILMPHLNLHSVPDNTNEKELIIKMILDQDEPLFVTENPGYMRKTTLMHLLNFASVNATGFSDRSFTQNAYKAKGIAESRLDDCLSGWYYYQLNEYWQYACTGILFGLMEFLITLVGTGQISISHLLNRSTEKIVEELKIKKNIVNPAHKIDGIRGIEGEIEVSLCEQIRKNSSIRKIVSGFLLLWVIYQRNKDQTEYLSHYLNQRQIANSHDVLYFLKRFSTQQRISFEQFIENFLHSEILYRHQHVALLKMGGGSQSTQKFILEDGYIRNIGNFDPSFTGPRVANLINFIRDLGIIDSDNIITQSGQKLIHAAI